MRSRGGFGPVPRKTREAVALRLARAAHRLQSDRYGAPLIEHIERVANNVPGSARAVALVHDMGERAGASASEVALIVGLDDDELQALVLLTKRRDESIVDHTKRIVREPESAGRELALMVKRADLDDHVRRTTPPPTQYLLALQLLDTTIARPFPTA